MLFLSPSLYQSLEAAGGAGAEGGGDDDDGDGCFFFFDETALGWNMTAPAPVFLSVSAFSLRFFDKSLTSALIFRPWYSLSFKPKTTFWTSSWLCPS